MTRRLIDYGPAAALLECENLAEVVGLLPQLRKQRRSTKWCLGSATLLRLLPRWMRRIVGCLRPWCRDRPKSMMQVESASRSITGRTLDGGRPVGPPAEVVELHTGQTWTVGFCGFTRASLTCKANTTGCGSPGGSSRARMCRPVPSVWRTRGRDLSTGRPRRLATHRPTDAQLWDLNRTPPALLQPGFQVRFTRRHRDLRRADRTTGVDRGPRPARLGPSRRFAVGCRRSHRQRWRTGSSAIRRRRP